MFGVIFMSDFALQAALRHELASLRDLPAAVLDENASGNPIILQVNRTALDAGVETGMTSSQGLARCGTLHLLPRSPAQEASVSEALLEIAFSCSPWVETTTDGVCTFEWRGERSPDTGLGEHIVAHLKKLDLQVRVGLADNPDLALLAAHAARPCLHVEDSRTFLANLPVTALRPTPHILAILQRWGIETLGGLTALSAQQVTRRLGIEGRRLWERAAGRQQRLLRLATAPVVYAESMEFEYEVQTLEPLLFVLRRFLEQLVLRLEATYRVPSSLSMTLRFDDGQEHQRRFSIPAPTNNVDTLFRVLHTHLENFTAPSLIRMVSLEATPTRASREQFGLFETALRDPNRFSETLARLNALLGPERTGIARQGDTHRPDAFYLDPPNFSHLADAGGAVVSIREPPIFGLPLCRLRPPVALQVEVEQRAPAYIRCTSITGKVLAVRGPYQLLGGWWESPGVWSCEEWDVEVAQGGFHRLSRKPDGWFLEGTYD